MYRTYSVKVLGNDMQYVPAEQLRGFESIPSDHLAREDAEQIADYLLDFFDPSEIIIDAGTTL
jgi:hypothetical protein